MPRFPSLPERGTKILNIEMFSRVRIELTTCPVVPLPNVWPICVEVDLMALNILICNIFFILLSLGIKSMTGLVTHTYSQKQQHFFKHNSIKRAMQIHQSDNDQNDLIQENSVPLRLTASL